MDVTSDAEMRPAFLITIDTEGDNAWARPRKASTRNAAYLPRFQALCERYGLAPTYLTTWEMAHAPAFQELGRDILARRTGEIGMHPHAWDMPPVRPLGIDDADRHPYLIEFPDEIARIKAATLTATLEETFGVKMVSHRAGRWALDTRYATILMDLGYRVDCSVTPHLHWPATGEPGCSVDYRAAPEDPYFVHRDDIARPGDCPLLEVPVTIRLLPRNGALWRFTPLATSHPPTLFRRAFRAFWLRPDGRNGRILTTLLDRVLAADAPCAEFMLHSSELMPDCSPRFPTAKSIHALYADMERLFEHARDRSDGLTLAQFAQRYSAGRSTKPRRERAG